MTIIRSTDQNCRPANENGHEYTAGGSHHVATVFHR